MRLSELNTIIEEVETKVMNLHFNSRQAGKEVDRHDLEVEAINTLLKYTKRFTPKDVETLVNRGVSHSHKVYNVLF